MTDDDEQDKQSAEKRRHPRHKANKDVRVEVDGEVVLGKASNISLSGVAVNSLVYLTTEQFVKLHLEKFGDLSGAVVRELEDGFAVEFDTIEDNGSVLEDKLRGMMGTKKPDPTSDSSGDEIARERARMEAQLMAMLGGGDDDD